MSCSPEQYASNLENSWKSTGPASPETKARVRKNALKHGLTGAGIAVPDEDVAVIQERFEAFDADLNPNRVVSEYLVRHLAMLSVRMDRCARHETASLTRSMLLAEQAESDIHRDHLQKLVDQIDENPEAAYRELQRCPRGIAWMIGAWEDLKSDLANPAPYRWNSARIERAENLIGHRYASPQLSRIGVLSNAYLGNLAGLGPDDWPDLPESERQQAAKAELGRIMDGEITRLKEVLEKLDREKLNRIESGAMTRALFDASKDAVLARKYAAAAERGFFKTLKTILELNASLVIVDNVNLSPDLEKGSGELALNWIEPESSSGSVEEVVQPKKSRPPAPADRRKSKARQARRSLERLRE